MRAASTPQDRPFALSPDELACWNEKGYLVRLNVFSAEENDMLRRVAEDVVDQKRPYPSTHVDQNALVRDGKAAQQGIYAMHKICLLYTSPSPRDGLLSRMPSSA